MPTLKTACSFTFASKVAEKLANVDHQAHCSSRAKLKEICPRGLQLTEGYEVARDAIIISQKIRQENITITVK
jgi:hypothetical protein